jgi:hypothetical protein
MRFPSEVSELELTGLERDAVKALLGRSKRQIDPQTADHLGAETGGNPRWSSLRF